MITNVLAHFSREKIEAIGIWGMRNESWGNVQDYRAHLTELIGSNLIAFQAIIRMVIESAFKFISTCY